MKYLMLVATAAMGLAQDAARPQFEVASIKPNHSGDMRMGVAMEPGGRLVATNVPVKMLIRMAYQLKDNQISGLPAWADSDRFDITAKPENGASIKTDDIRLMEQALLADRFKLTFHKETKELPIYALVVSRGGLKMAVSKGNADFGDDAPARSAEPGPGRGRGQGIRMMRGELNGQNVTVGMLADQLSNIVGRSVIDKTGLTGNYDFTLKYTPEGGSPGPKGPDSAEAAPSESQTTSVFVAVQEQLGLKLEAQKGPVDLYIIDRVEKPSEN
jgi:uncharacterized protein (TIGR03435 family)